MTSWQVGSYLDARPFSIRFDAVTIRGGDPSASQARQRSTGVSPFTSHFSLPMYTGAMRTLPVRLLDLATALEDHDRESEAEALAANEEEGNHDDAGEDEFEGDSHDELEEFDEDEEGEPVDFLSEEEEALLTEFVDSLPGANFSLAKLHGLCSAFAAGPVTMAPTDLLGVLTGFAKGGQVNDFGNSVVILDLLSRFYGGIVEALEFESFEPQLEQTGDTVTEPSAAIISWCNGFMLGVDH